MVTTEELLDGIVARCEDVAVLLEKGRVAPGTAALLLRQGAAHVRQGLGTPITRPTAKRLYEED